MGVLLKETEAMELFGARYEVHQRDNCDKHGKQQGPYCSECGGDLRYKEKTSQGIDDFDDFYNIDDLEDELLKIREFAISVVNYLVR